MTKSKKSNILITGAAGFIPSCLAHRLFKEGHDLVSRG